MPVQRANISRFHICVQYWSSVMRAWFFYFFWHVTHGRLRTCLQWRRIGKRMCNLWWSVYNIVELVHAKITHTYAAARQLSGMPSGLCYLMFSEFQICLFWVSFRGKGCRFPTKTCNSGRLHNLDWHFHARNRFITYRSQSSLTRANGWRAA